MPKTPRRRPPPEHLITTPLLNTHCRHCQAPIWEGHCGGIKTRIDPTPINAHAELGATLTGTPTYQIPNTHTRRPTIRDQFNLHHRPTDATIHAAHQCGRVWPNACIDTPPHTETTAPNPLAASGNGLFDDPPPF